LLRSAAQFQTGESKRDNITGRRERMLLTKKGLRTILENLRVTVPAELEQQLLAEYGNPVTDDEGRVLEYTEQDIYEQLRKRVLPYARNQ